MKNEANASVWRARMAACKDSGLQVTEFCLQNGLRTRGYFYWKRRLARTDNAASSERATNTLSTDWLCVEPNAPLAPVRQQTLTVKISGAEIEVGADFNPSLLRSVVIALGALPC